MAQAGVAGSARSLTRPPEADIVIESLAEFPAALDRS